MNKRYVKEFRKQGLLGYSILCSLLVDGFRDVKGKQIVYRAVKNRYLARLRRKYKPVIQKYLADNPNVNALPHVRSNKVWVCWLQGLENAPELIRKCYASMQRQLPKDRELILITQDNFRDYIELPEHILSKYESGQINMTLFSDLVRTNLLIQHGGTWMDATVFLSDGDIPQVLLDTDLLFFQFSDPKNFYKVNKGFDDRCLAVSNWFITSCTNNEVLLLVRHLMYHFWQNDVGGDFFIYHYMTQLALETYPQIWEKMPFFCGKNAFALQERMFDAYDAREWELIRRCSPIHKLSYRPLRNSTPDADSYCGMILRDAL